MADFEKKPTIAILGGGLAGLGAAWQLTRRGLAEPCVLEQCSDVGGNAGGFELDGVPVDYGSHRLHPACDPDILDDSVPCSPTTSWHGRDTGGYDSAAGGSIFR